MENKLKLREDLDLELPSYEGQDIQDLYDEQGIDVFSEENLPLLKQAGLLDENGYPIEQYETWNGEMKTRPMSLSDLFTMDSDFINNPHIRKLAIAELLDGSKLDENGNIKINYTDKDLPNIRDISKDFLEGCFSGDVWDFFMGWGDYSFHDCKYALDDIPDEVLDILESKGFPRDIYTQLMEGTADDEGPLADWYDSLESALVMAYQCGEENGSAAAAENDFNNAFRESMPDGVEWIETESTESKRPLLVSEDFVENCIEGIWNYLDNYSSDMYSAFEEYLKEKINENLADNFREPYYGWQEFDGDSFADRLLEEIMELDIPDARAVDFELPEQEKDLLSFDGESGEYREDLELDTDIQVEKPKKLFYKYKDYNKEISSKSYRLNYIMVSELLEFLRKPESRRYVSTGDLKELEEYGMVPEDAQYVIISQIKPSYLPTYGQHGWTIWIDNGDYDLNYIGWIPKDVGDSILHSMTEDLELDVTAIPDIDIDETCYFDGIEDLVMNSLTESVWGVYIINWSTEEVDYEVSATTVDKALERFKSCCKNCEDNETIVLYVYKDSTGEDIPIKDFDKDDIEEDLEPELHYYMVWWCDENDLEDGEMFRTPIITRQTNDVKPTPAEVIAMYSEDGNWQGNPGYVIVDVDEVTEEEYKSFFCLPRDFEVFDLTKYNPVTLAEEEALPDYTYYECYMEPVDKTNWDPDNIDDWEPLNDNISFIIKVQDNEPEPSPEEVETFLYSTQDVPEGYKVLYLSELDGDDEFVEEAEEIPEFIPNINSIDLN